MNRILIILGFLFSLQLSSQVYTIKSFKSNDTLSQSDYRMAILYATKNIKSNPTSFIDYKVIGDSYYYLNEFDSSLLSYNMALKFYNNPTEKIVILNSTAGTYLAKKNIKEAMKYFNESLIIDNFNVDANYGLFTIYYNQSKYKKSIRYLEKIGSDQLIKDSLHILSYMINLMKLKKYEIAIKVGQAIIEKDSNDYNVNLNMGYLYMKIKNYDKSIFFYKKALDTGGKFNCSIYDVISKLNNKINHTDKEKYAILYTDCLNNKLR